MSRAAASRVLTVFAVLAMVVAGIGFIASLFLNAFVLDRYNAYGEVPVPGTATLHLPAGEVDISFHTQIIGSGNGSLPVPDLRMGIDPPAGVREPTVTENIGGTTTVNNDARIRVWVAQIAEDGDYRIQADGNVSAFVSPRLAFGHGSPYGAAPWWCAGLFVASALVLVLALVWGARVRAAPRPVGAIPATFDIGDTSSGFQPPYVPTEDGIRLQQLNNLTALRDCGALTEAEFETERRRLLGGG